MRKALRRLALAASTAVLCGLPAYGQEFGLYAFDTTYTLAFEHPGRGSLTPRFAPAADYMEDRLTFGAMAPTRQDFSWSQGQRTSQNLLLTMSGASPKYIVVGAHFDTAGNGDTLQGVDDNGSGAGVLTELAAHMNGLSLGTGIVFAAFGAEELGLRGSRAYLDLMTPEERANIAGMINIDSLVTGDFMYAHAGTNIERDAALKSYWDAVHAIAKEQGIDLRSNPGYNQHYPLDTGCCSDAEPFEALDIPVLWLEATNWDIGDLDGYTQTTNPAIETGSTWHNATRDNWDYLVNAFGEDRIPDRLEAYSRLLTLLLVRLTDADLIASAADAGASAYQMAEMMSQRSRGMTELAMRNAEARLSRAGAGASAAGSTLSSSGFEAPKLRPVLQVSGLARPSGSPDAGIDHSNALSLLLGLTYDASADLSLGVTLAYGRNEDTLSAGGSIDQDGVTLGLDLAFENGPLWAVALAHVGQNSVEGTRDFTLTSGLGAIVAQGRFGLDTDAETRGVAVKLGYDLATTPALRAGLFGGLDYTHYQIDGFSETGTERGTVTYDEQAFESAELALGGRVQRTIAVGSMPVVLGAEASWVHELADGAPTSMSITDEEGTVQTASYSRADKSFGRVGLSADILVSDQTTGWVTLASRVDHDAGSQWSVSAGLGMRF